MNAVTGLPKYNLFSSALFQHHSERVHRDMSVPNQLKFDPADFLAHPGQGRSVVHLKAKESFFTQGDVAESIYFIQSGRAKLTVLSKGGKEATITLLGAGDFVGEEVIAAVAGPHTTTARAVTACSAMKIKREAMMLAMHEEKTFSDFFLAFLLARSMRVQADLVDQLFNNSEKRLARMLLLMADHEGTGEQETLIPHVTQETLADMIGTTRSRVSFFMNRFRKRGFISYNAHIRVHKSLQVVLHD